LALHKEKLNKNKVRIVNGVSFLVGFSQAAIVYVLSTYFKQASGTENVGIFYTGSYLIILLLLLNLHKLVRGFGKIRIFIFSSFLKIAANILIIAFQFSNLSVVFLVLYVVFMGVEWANLDSILETFSEDKTSGRIRGMHLTILNLGFIFGPLLSTTLLQKFDFRGVFFLALGLNILIFLIALVGFHGIDGKFEKKVRSLEVITLAIKNKNIFSIYYISFVLEFFYALMVIYSPIYLHDLGFSWEKIGIAFTIMLIPFVILQYPAGIMADKKYGEKELLIISIFIMALSTMAFYLFSSKSIFFWAAVLFATRIGAALVEILRDSYFYKQVDGRDVDIINFFRSAMPVGYVVGTAISAIILLFFPLRSIFIIVVFVVLSALYPAIKLEDSRSEKE